MTIPLQYTSDLHLDDLETYCPSEMVRPVADILVMAGDICRIETIEAHHAFFKWVNQSFQYVLYVPGNHEFYSESKTVRALEEELSDFLTSFPNIIYLNNSSIVIQGILFTGSCLWCYPRHDPPEWFLAKLTKQDIRDMHQEALSYLYDVSNIRHPRHVMITHYPPLHIIRDGKKRYPSKYDDYYQNHTIQLRFPPVVWIFGHNHMNHLSKMSGTLYVANQRKGKLYQADARVPLFSLERWQYKA